MPIDIRDYLPPSLRHVKAYANPDEREKRRQAARDAFGRPTPMPQGSEPVPSADQGEGEEQTLEKAAPASPWSAGVVDGVDKDALPSALMPPDTAPGAKVAVRPAVRVVSLRTVMTAAVFGLVAGGAVIVRARWTDGAARGVVPPGSTSAAMAAPSATEAASAATTGAVPPASTAPGVSAAPPVAPAAPIESATSTRSHAAPAATTTGGARPTSDPNDPYSDPPRAVSAPDAGPRPPAVREPVINE